LKFLLDENLKPLTAQTLDVLASEQGDSFVHICDEDIAGEGAEDEVIPGLCRDNHCDAVITVNVRDFGAKKALYQALLAEGIHVVVVRPGRVIFQAPQQVALLSGKYPTYSRFLREADGKVLVRVTQSDVKVRTLDELVAEISGD
jgi:hypothetical protein